MLTGNTGINLLEGGAGTDRLVGGGGIIDFASYRTSTSGLTVNLGATSQNTGDALGDTYSGIRGLEGSVYNDTLIGDAQNNYLRGGLGGDALIGAAGTDTADYSLAVSGVVVNLANASDNIGEAAGDTFNLIENIRGSAFDDVLSGDGQVNYLEGGAGADALHGGGGTNDYASYLGSAQGLMVSLADPSLNTGDAIGDTYFGISGLQGSNFNDTLIGDSNDNLLDGAGGSDLLIGGEGSDAADYSQTAVGFTASLANAAQNTGVATGDYYVSIENLRGGAGADILIGDDHDNRLRGNQGADQLLGGEGSDTADYGGSGGVTANLADASKNTGMAAGDTYNSIENLRGSSNVDILTGDANANFLWGVGGDDRLDGSAGSDTLMGDLGADTFVFSSGADVIVDFTQAQGDRIDLTGVAGVRALDDVLSHTTQLGADTIIDFGAGGTLTLQGVVAANLTANDFLFRTPVLNVPQEFATITAAMPYAAQGDTILIDGSYAGPEIATVSVSGLTVSAPSGVSGIALLLGAGVSGLALAGDASFQVTGNGLDNAICARAAMTVSTAASATTP